MKCTSLTKRVHRTNQTHLDDHHKHFRASNETVMKTFYWYMRIVVVYFANWSWSETLRAQGVPAWSSRGRHCACASVFQQRASLRMCQSDPAEGVTAHVPMWPSRGRHYTDIKVPFELIICILSVLVTLFNKSMGC